MRSFAKNKLVLFALLLAALGLGNLVQETIREVGRSAAAPLQGNVWQAGSGVSGFFQGIVRGPALVRVVEELTQENLRLRQELVDKEELEDENKRLREALDVEIQEDFQLQLVRILGKDPARDLLFLNKGREDGVRQGMPVVTQSKVAVGYVKEAFKNTSELLLLSDKASSFDAKVQEKEIVAVLKGQGSSRAVLDLVPFEASLQAGDVVLTSSLGGIFPENLLVGTIEEVEKSDLEAFQRGTVELFYAPQNSATLFVILNHEK